MKRFIACFIISLIGLSMLIQPVIAYNPQQLDTLDIYIPYYIQFIDSTVSPYDTFYTKVGELKNAYGLFEDSLIVDGVLKGDTIYVTSNASYPIRIYNYKHALVDARYLYIDYGDGMKTQYIYTASDSVLVIKIANKVVYFANKSGNQLLYLSKDSTYMYDVYIETLTIAVMETLGAYWDTLGQIDSSTFADTSEYSRDSDKWDGYQFADYLNQGVRTTDSVQFATYEINMDSNYTYIGENAGSGAGQHNIYIGVDAGKLNQAGGIRNVGIGNYALDANTTGNYNMALGFNTMSKNTTGQYNTAVGYTALFENTTKNANTAVGYNALRCSDDGQYNTAIGCFAGYYMGKTVNSMYNTAIGPYALYTDSMGGYNIGIGYQTGYYLTGAGIENVFIGYRAALSCGADPDRNVAIGCQAGYNVEGDYNMFIGWKAGYTLTNVNYQLHIAASPTDSLIYGEFNNHYLYFKDSVRTKSFVVDKIYAGGGEQLVKFVKVGSHCAIILNASADTFWLAADTTGF